MTTDLYSVFTREQQKNLVRRLRRDRRKTELFVANIERPLCEFVLWKYAKCEGTIPSRIKTLKHLQMAQRQVAAAHVSLSGLGQGDGHWWLIDQLCGEMPRQGVPETLPPQDGEAEYRAYEAEAMKRESLAEEYLADLTAKLAHLQSIMELGLPRFSKPSKGRPQSRNERDLIRRVAEEHRKCFGRLPSSSKTGNFHKFMLLLLEYAECPQADCSRVLKAIDGLKRGDEDSD